MTAGQERALRELQRLKHQGEGDFDFATLELGGNLTCLVVTVSVRVGLLETCVGGLEFREREEFVVMIPPGFPFDKPSIMVTHRRFSGFPHVIWSRTLCLYQSSIEWTPSAGLFGFFERLDKWLVKAALNDMDPLEGPLEPPHHNTDFSHVPFVIRANAPSSPGEQWIGFSEFQVLQNRIEVTGWHKLGEKFEGGRRALAFMLPKALPMEFPTKGKEFFSELIRQGYNRNQILLLLALAALNSPEGEPVYLFLGVPMRRATDGGARMHIAVWSTTPEMAKSLRITLHKDGDTEELRELRDEMGDLIFEIFEATTISWCPVMEDRSEVVVRRDAGRSLSWFLGKRVLLLGCGALGSWAAEIVARAGAKSLDLVDNGLVKPGLLARQNYRTEDIGDKKAQALAVRLKALIQPGIDIHPFAHEAHSFVISDPARFAEYDLVLDCTASHLFQMKMERDWTQLSGNTPSIVSMITDAKAQKGLCVVIPRNQTGGPWHAYMRLKHRLCLDGSHPEFTSSFYDLAALGDLFQPEPGCSDPTFSGSAADAMSIAAITLNTATEHGLLHDAEIGIAFSVPSTGTPVLDIGKLTDMDRYQVGRYRVHISKKVTRKVRAWVKQNNRLRTADHETGGILWGMWDDATEVIWIFDVSGPPKDSIHEPGHFLCGIEGTAEENDNRVKLSYGTTGFVGYWHTHPDMPSHQSSTDLHGMSLLVSTVGQNQKRALMLIYGRAKDQPTAGIYIYESNSLGEKWEGLRVESTQISMERAVV